MKLHKCLVISGLALLQIKLITVIQCLSTQKENENYALASDLESHSCLSWIYSGLWCVCSTSSFSLEANVIISVGSAQCSPHSAASARGSALLGICS